MAPEVIQGEYDSQCDVWSAGVVLYMLVSGRPPFDGHDDITIVKKVKYQKLRMNYPEFDDVSIECKDLIKKLLRKNPNKRITPNEVLEHQCIKQRYEKSIGVSRQLFSALINLQNFEYTNKLEGAIIEFIVNEFATE